MRKNNKTLGHLLALFTVLIWGTTFISTKVLLNTFKPIEILFYRFFFAYIFLFLLYPRFMKYKNIKEELLFFGAGISGVTFYFLFENTALTYTYASNVGVLTSIAPFFVVLLSWFFLKDEKINLSFFIGFVISIIGIILITFNGKFVLNLNPFGDFLAISATFFWGLYSIFMKKIGDCGYNMIGSTRKIFFYGIITIIPAMFIFDFNFKLEGFNNYVNLLNLIFLSLGGSAIGYVTWNNATKILGAIKTSVYIYMIPIVTVIVSVLILNEKITMAAIGGMVLIIIGLVISERIKKKS